MEPKMVIVMRKDLKMRRGKECSQACHAAMAILLDKMTWVRRWDSTSIALSMPYDDPLYKWLKGSFTKIVVSVDSIDELMNIYWQAKDAGLSVSIIKDNGKTEFKKPTVTCIAIGPDWPNKIDKITKELKLR